MERIFAPAAETETPKRAAIWYRVILTPLFVARVPYWQEGFYILSRNIFPDGGQFAVVRQRRRPDFVQFAVCVDGRQALPVTRPEAHNPTGTASFVLNAMVDLPTANRAMTGHLPSSFDSFF